MEEKSNKGIIALLIVIIIILLTILILFFTGAVKLNSDVSDDEVANDSNEIVNTDIESNLSVTLLDNNESYNAGKMPSDNYFEQYLSVFTHSADNFYKDIDTFSNEDITEFLFWYYSRLVNLGKLEANQTNSDEPYSAAFTYTVDKSELDEVVYTFFGITDYQIIESVGKNGLEKNEDGTYTVYWFAAGYVGYLAENLNVVFNGDNAICQYDLVDYYSNQDGVKVGTLKINMTYNESDGIYKVKSIEYNENND